jgi:hypothetical protein
MTTSRMVNLLRVTGAPIQVSDILGPTVCFKFLNFFFPIFSASLSNVYSRHVYITQKEIAIDKFRLCDVAETEVCHFENIFTIGTNERNLKQEFPLALCVFLHSLDNSYFYKLQ